MGLLRSGVARPYFMGIPGNVKQCIDAKNGARARKTEKTGDFVGKLALRAYPPPPPVIDFDFLHESGYPKLQGQDMQQGVNEPGIFPNQTRQL